MKEYHQPDDRWEVIFGIKDFETYKQWLVVKGLFHENVPKDVVESFILCEYMMAHAYYHYPLFDEALSKLLRIIEMSIKIRCKDLKISLDRNHTNPNKIQSIKKKLFELINDLDSNEPNKKIKYALDSFRIIRNNIMHPESHTYSGATFRNTIIFGLVILNMLFLPDQLFVEFESEISRIKSIQANFSKSLYVMTYKGRRVLIEELDMMGAIPVNSNWQYLIVAKPVLDLPEFMEFTYPVPIIESVTNVEFKDKKLIMTMTETGEQVQFEETNHKDNETKYRNYVELRESSDKSKLLTLQQVMEYEVNIKKNEFWYNGLWKIK